MAKQYHILNDDSLKGQFPQDIDGEVIIARECLVDGDVSGDTLDELFYNRAMFISEFYGDYSIQEYYRDTVEEFDKIKNIPAGSEINLWFEDDLFCQVNFWFTAFMITKFLTEVKVYLIRPETHTQYGFGGLNKRELKDIYEKRAELKELKQIAVLWKLYSGNKIEALKEAVSELKSGQPFIYDAVIAHIERLPSDDNPRRPLTSLKQIIKDLDSTEFGPIFREFTKREYIYGFGDLQVRRLLEELKK